MADRFSFNDAYQILWIPFGSDKKRIIRAFRKLAMIHHPDRWWDEEKFKEINEARMTCEKYLEYTKGSTQQKQTSQERNSTNASNNYNEGSFEFSFESLDKNQFEAILETLLLFWYIDGELHSSELKLIQQFIVSHDLWKFKVNLYSFAETYHQKIGDHPDRNHLLWILYDCLDTLFDLENDDKVQILKLIETMIEADGHLAPMEWRLLEKMKSYWLYLDGTESGDWLTSQERAEYDGYMREMKSWRNSAIRTIIVGLAISVFFPLALIFTVWWWIKQLYRTWKVSSELDKRKKQHWDHIDQHNKKKKQRNQKKPLDKKIYITISESDFGKIIQRDWYKFRIKTHSKVWNTYTIKWKWYKDNQKDTNWDLIYYVERITYTHSKQSTVWGTDFDIIGRLERNQLRIWLAILTILWYYLFGWIWWWDTSWYIVPTPAQPSIVCKSRQIKKDWVCICGSGLYNENNQCITYQPTHGKIFTKNWSYFNNDWHEITVNNSQWSWDALVKIVDKFTKRSIISVYIQKWRSHIVTNLVDGTYDIYFKYFSYTTWSLMWRGSKKMESSNLMKTTTQWNYYYKSTLDITLYTVPGGKEETDTVNSDIFDNL